MICAVSRLMPCAFWPGHSVLMASTVGPRALTPDEVSLLRAVVAAVGGPAADVLDRQIAEASVVGGIPTLLHLKIESGQERAVIADGPLPVEAFVSHPQGWIFVWVTDGYIDALEFAWTSDETPTEMPSAAELTVAT